MATYYVDGATGDNTNTGLIGFPWAHPEELRNRSFIAGDLILVDDGTYNASAIGNYENPAAMIGTGNGTVSFPITIRSVNPLGAALVCHATSGAPAIGAKSDYINIEDFEIDGNAKDRAVAWLGTIGTHLNGGELSGCEVHNGYKVGQDNTDLLRLDYCDNFRAHHNSIHNCYNSLNTNNAAGIKLFSCIDITLDWNIVYDCVAGMKPKEADTNLLIADNLFYDCGRGIALHTQLSTSTNITVTRNVVRDVSTCIDVEVSASDMNGLHVYSNTFENYSGWGFYLWRDATPGNPLNIADINIWDNIFAPGVGRTGHEFACTNDIVPDFTIFDHNLYYDDYDWQVGRYQAGALTYTSLATWQGSATSPDANSIGGSDPLFVDKTGNDFHLQAGSPAIGAGRFGQDIGALQRSPRNMAEKTYVTSRARL